MLHRHGYLALYASLVIFLAAVAGLLQELIR